MVPRNKLWVATGFVVFSYRRTTRYTCTLDVSSLDRAHGDTRRKGEVYYHSNDDIRVWCEWGVHEFCGSFARALTYATTVSIWEASNLLSWATVGNQSSAVAHTKRQPRTKLKLTLIHFPQKKDSSCPPIINTRRLSLFQKEQNEKTYIEPLLQIFK